MPARRASHSEATSAASAIRMATMTSRPRRAFAARHLQEGIDRRRNGLRLAGNVGDESNRGAEFAQRLGKAQHHAGDDAGQRQRQGDGEKGADAVGAERGRGVFQPSIDRLERQPGRSHQQGKTHDAAGECRAGPAEGKHDPEIVLKETADGSFAAERQQQQIAGHHRRQHERQMHDTVEQRLAPEILARQQPGHGDAEGQCGERRRHRDAQR